MTKEKRTSFDTYLTLFVSVVDTENVSWNFDWIKGTFQVTQETRHKQPITRKWKTSSSRCFFLFCE